MKLLKAVIFILSSVLCGSAYSSHEFEFTDDVKAFQQAIRDSQIFNGFVTLQMAPKRRQELMDLAKKFDGFEVKVNHFLCEGCDPFNHKNKGQDNQRCWFASNNCMDYTIQKLIMDLNIEDAIKNNSKIDIRNYKDYLGFEETNNPEESLMVTYGGGHWGLYCGNGIVESKWARTRAVFDISSHKFQSHIQIR